MHNQMVVIFFVTFHAVAQKSTSYKRELNQLCTKSESPAARESLLIPFAPDPGLKGQHCWLHAACMLWSHGVDRMENSKHHVFLYRSQQAVFADASHRCVPNVEISVQRSLVLKTL